MGNKTSFTQLKYYGFPKESLKKIIITALDAHNTAMAICGNNKEVYQRAYCTFHDIASVPFVDYGGVPIWLYNRIWKRAQDICIDIKNPNGVKGINIEKKFMYFINE